MDVNIDHRRLDTLNVMRLTQDPVVILGLLRRLTYPYSGILLGKQSTIPGLIKLEVMGFGCIYQPCIHYLQSVSRAVRS